jgi:hypothetical protein
MFVLAHLVRLESIKQATACAADKKVLAQCAANIPEGI